EAMAIDNMKKRYQQAEALARASGSDALFYPALNRMAAELIADGGKSSWSGFDADSLAQVEAQLAHKTRDDPDFWSVVGLTELRLYRAVAERRLAGEMESSVWGDRRPH